MHGACFPVRCGVDRLPAIPCRGLAVLQGHWHVLFSVELVEFTIFGKSESWMNSHGYCCSETADAGTACKEQPVHPCAGGIQATTRTCCTTAQSYSPLPQLCPACRRVQVRCGSNLQHQLHALQYTTRPEQGMARHSLYIGQCIHEGECATWLLCGTMFVACNST